MSELPCTPDVVLHQVAIESVLRAPRRRGDRLRPTARGGQRISIAPVGAGHVDGGPARQLTDGAGPRFRARYSPDGRTLAFVRTPEGADHGQAWLLELDGPEAPADSITSLPHGVSSVTWSPDGEWLALLAPSADDVPFIVGPEIPGKAPLARRHHAPRLAR